MYQPVIQNSYLAEIKLVNAPAAGQKVNFLDIPQLRDDPRDPRRRVFTVGISCYNSSQLAVSPNSNTVVATLTGIVVTFAIHSTEEIFQIPAIDLNSATNSGLIRLFKDKVINFPKSYITILDATGLNQNESVLFNIIYRRGGQ